MHLLLTEAEGTWRDEVRRDFPLRADTPVIKDRAKPGRDWEFSTDLTKIFASISNDKSLRQKFETVITQYWNGDPEELARETLHYLLFHELYHPLEAPFSVSGDDNDNKKIHQAIRRGLLKAESRLNPLEQIVKVQASQNGVKDFILDNRFYLDNATHGYVRGDIIPAWDVLELQDIPTKTNFYTVTRLVYGLLYGPEKTHKFFEGRAGKKGLTVAKEALSALLETPIEFAQKKKETLVDRFQKMVKLKPSSKEVKPTQDYAPEIRKVFAGVDRYKGIERLMTVLGPYVEKDMPQSRPEIGEGTGASPQSILQDLLDDMTPEEQQQFVQSLPPHGSGPLAQAAQSQSSGSIPGENASAVDQMKNLDLLATHEYYKRNHPTVHIIGGKMIGESAVVDTKEYWHLKSSTVLTEDRLSNLNLHRIDILQRRTKLPWLIDLGNGTYRLNEYDLRRRDVKDTVYVEANIDVPDVVELYVDSSGSMFKGQFAVNDGSRWDMLSSVLYGFVDALQQGGKQVGKQSKIRIHNFANHQVDSPLISVEQFWRGDISLLKTLFIPENGYGQEDLNLQAYNDSQKRAYVVVTDGELVISGRTEREAAKMRSLAQRPQNSVVLFEIGGTYSLGNAVRNEPSIRYHPVHDKAKMLEAGLEVLLSKHEEKVCLSGVPKNTGGFF